MGTIGCEIEIGKKSLFGIIHYRFQVLGLVKIVTVIIPKKITFRLFAERVEPSLILLNKHFFFEQLVEV